MEKMFDDVSNEEPDFEIDLTDSNTLRLYSYCADAVNQAMIAVLKECVPGKKIIDLVTLGDSLILSNLEKIEASSTVPNPDGGKNSDKAERGIAFPTCVSVNNCAGHFSPLSDDKTVLKDGDIVKVDMAGQLDGLITAAAHTLNVKKVQKPSKPKAGEPPAPVEPPQPLSGKAADVICAAHFAAEVVLRVLKPGTKNTDITRLLRRVADDFHVNPVDGVLSHEMKRFLIDGEQVIINRATSDHKVNEFEIQPNQIYCIDIVMSSGEGKTREMDTKTTIFKRTPDSNYLLKLKAARYVLNEIDKNHPVFPFSTRYFAETRAKFGIVECLTHNLVQAYPVLYEKNNEIIAQYKFTVLVLEKETLRLSAFPAPFVKSQYTIADDELKKILSSAPASAPQQAEAQKKKKKKKAKKPAQAKKEPEATTE